MADAHLSEHLRTPRGKGRNDGALHAATSAWLRRTVPCASAGMGVATFVERV